MPDFKILSGSSITSANVAANKSYASGRNIENLNAVKALTADELALLRRVDGVIASQPADSRAAVDEMVRLEQPDFKATLFPDEQALQPVIWKALEWETSALVSKITPLLDLNSLVKATVTTPGGLNTAKNELITALPQELQRTASRVQLVLNGDNNAATISIDDVQRAIDKPDRFLPSEKAEFQRIKELLMKMQSAQFTARLEVPEPGTKVQNFPGLGAAELKFTTSVAIREDRSATSNGACFYAHSRSLNVIRESTLSLTLPADHQAILIDRKTGQERVIQASGALPSDLAGTQQRLELYKNGKRVQSNDVDVPVYAAREVFDAKNSIGFELVSGGQPLVRSAVATSSWGATWNYDKVAAPPMQNPPSANVLAEIEAPRISLDPGRYKVPLDAGKTCFLDIYKNGVVFFEDSAGSRQRLLEDNGSTRTFRSADGSVGFDPSRNIMSVPSSRAVQLATDMRVG